jgi:dipeptidase E
MSIRNNFGGDMEFINLLALPLTDVERRIKTKDVIFIIGGNTEYLMSVFQKTGFSKLLPKLLEEKIYVGSSAGSMVLGIQPPLALQAEFYGEELDYGTKKYLELIDYAILPHLDSPHFNNFRRREKYLPAFDKIPKAYFLSDASALIVENTKTYPIGKNYVELENGKITENAK